MKRVLCLIMPLFASTVLALPEKKGEGKETRRVTATVQATAAANSEYNFQDARFDFYDDGSWGFYANTVPERIEGAIDAVGFVEADMRAATYRATLTDRVLQYKAGDPSRDIANDPNWHCCTQRCDGNVRLTLSEEDPADIVVATTTAYGTWANKDDTADNEGCWWSGNGHGTAVPVALTPYPLNTHWYTSGAQTFGPYLSYRSFDIKQTANYYNWDFMLDDYRTDVSHLARIVFQGGYLSYGIGYGAKGEAANLLHAFWYPSGYNTCK